MKIIDKITKCLAKRKVEVAPPEVIEVQPLIERKKLDIIVDKQVRTKYQKGWIKKIREIPIDEIVIHGTAGGNSAESLLLWMLNGQRAKEYYKGIALFHYLIDRADSNIVEVLDPSYWVYHSSSGKLDRKTIGIELINPSKTNREPYTEEQYTLLFDLIFKHLLPTYPTITQIVSHDYNILTYSGKPPKGCPGAGFDWSLLEKEIVINNRKYHKIKSNAIQLL